MRRITLCISLTCVALVTVSVRATSTDPFDFEYEIEGGLAERPALIFNDGSKTYLQPRAGQVITADGAHPEGPFVVIDGTPETIRYSVAGHAATARWKRANAFIGRRGNGQGQQDDQPADFNGFTNRLVLIGQHGQLEPVRALRATMPVANLVKALVPQGWTGSAQKDVDLTDATLFETHSSENWLQSLDRLMTQGGLYADVDFDARHLRLHRDAPKSAGLNYAPGDVKGAARSSDARDAISAPAVSGASLLARYFGAQAIRDGDDAHAQIRFPAKPAGELTFTSADGASLHPKWDEETHVLTIDRAALFVVSNGTNRVEVTRAGGIVYDFDQASPAHLEAVFDRDGSTYFKFAESVVQVNVADVRHLGSGEQKGRYYRFNGTAEQFIVTADGNTVNVVRRHDVRYVERAAGETATTRTAAVSP